MNYDRLRIWFRRMINWAFHHSKEENTIQIVQDYHAPINLAVLLLLVVRNLLLTRMLVILILPNYLLHLSYHLLTCLIRNLLPLQCVQPQMINCRLNR